MPRIIRIALNDSAREDLREYLKDPSVPARVRERLEMVRLSDLGWSIPRIAEHLEIHEQTVRKYIKAFMEEGFNALPDRARSGRPPTVTSAHLQLIEGKVSEWSRSGRRWTLADLAWWLNEAHGITISTSRLSALLHRRDESRGSRSFRAGTGPNRRTHTTRHRQLA